MTATSRPPDRRIASPVRLRRAGPAGGLAAAVLLLGGCSSEGTAIEPTLTPTTTSGVPVPPATSAPPPSASASVDPAAQAKAEVLRVYGIFMDARNKSLNNPKKPPDRRLFQVSIPPARNSVYNLVLHDRRFGIETHGATVSTILRITLSANEASLVDCVDSSGAVPVIAKTGKSILAPDQNPRVIVSATAIRQGSGGWVVSRWVPDREEKC